MPKDESNISRAIRSLKGYARELLGNTETIIDEDYCDNLGRDLRAIARYLEKLKKKNFDDLPEVEQEKLTRPKKPKKEERIMMVGKEIIGGGKLSRKQKK